MKTRIINTTTGTASGNVDYTSAGFGTPTAVIMIASNSTVASPIIVDARMSFGFTDGTDAYCVALNDENGNGTTLTERESFSGSIYIDPSFANTRADFVSLITDGIRVNYNDTPAAARSLTIILISGTFNVKAFSHLLPASGVSDITSIGFKPNLTLLSTVGHTAIAAESLAPATFSLGWVHNSSSDVVTQAFAAQYSANGVSTSDVWARRHVDAAIGEINAGGGVWTAVASAFDASGFTLTVTGASSNYIFGLAIDTGDTDGVQINSYNSPTATGELFFTTTGLDPSHVMMIGGAGSNSNTPYSGQNGGVFGISNYDGTTESYVGIAVEDAAATSDTDSHFSSSDGVSHYMFSGGTSSALNIGSFTGLNAGNFSIDFPATVDASNVYRWLALAVSGNVIVQVPLASISLSGLTPLATINHRYNIPRGDLIPVGITPTITFNTRYNVPTASLLMGGLIPNVTIEESIQVVIPLGALLPSGLAPAVNQENNIYVIIPQAQIILLGLAPVANEEVSQIIEVPTGILGMVAYTVIVSAPTVINIPAASLALTGIAPSISTPEAVTVPTASASMIGYLPIVIQPRLVDIPKGELIIGSNSPTIINNRDIPVPIGAVSLSTFAPHIVIPNGPVIPLASLTMAGYSPVAALTGSFAIRIPTGIINLSGKVVEVRVRVLTPIDRIIVIQEV